MMTTEQRWTDEQVIEVCRRFNIDIHAWQVPVVAGLLNGDTIMLARGWGRQRCRRLAQDLAETSDRV